MKQGQLWKVYSCSAAQEIHIANVTKMLIKFYKEPGKSRLQFYILYRAT
jgi:hypothetical protein